jgi:hypothetical protein
MQFAIVLSLVLFILTALLLLQFFSGDLIGADEDWRMAQRHSPHRSLSPVGRIGRSQARRSRRPARPDSGSLRRRSGLAMAIVSPPPVELPSRSR